MRWARISVLVPPDATEAVWPVFEAIGCAGIEISETNGATAVSGYLPVCDGMDDLVARVEQGAFDAGVLCGHARRPEVVLTFVEDEDWATSWKAHFHPTRVGRRFLICPSWELTDPQPGGLRIVMDPGMAFGSGTHESTQLALEALEDTVHPGDTVIDVGCGSGILAIGAALLGAARVDALDIDPVAVDVARANLVLNGVGDVVRVTAGELADVHGAKADIVVANIVAPVVAGLMEAVWRRMAPSGVFIGSGIVADRLDLVTDAATGRFTVESVRARNDWRCVVLRHARCLGEEA